MSEEPFNWVDGQAFCDACGECMTLSEIDADRCGYCGGEGDSDDEDDYHWASPTDMGAQ